MVIFCRQYFLLHAASIAYHLYSIYQAGMRAGEQLISSTVIRAPGASLPYFIVGSPLIRFLPVFHAAYK